MDAMQYVQAYHNLWTPEFQLAGGRLQGSGALGTPVLQYLNLKYKNKAGKTPSDRLAYKDHLLGFFKNRAKEADSGVSYTKSDGYDLTCSPFAVDNFPKSAFMACFSGKGSPKMLSDMIQLISYWRSYKMLKEGNSGVSAVAEIVDKYLGVDCNGFVGHYLRAKYAGVGVGPSTTEKTYSLSGNHRGFPTEIFPDDVLVFDNFHHVAMVGYVFSRSPAYAECAVCESRGKDHGGPQVNIWRIENQKNTGGIIPGRFLIKTQSGVERDKIDSVVRIWGT